MSLSKYEDRIRDLVSNCTTHNPHVNATSELLNALGCSCVQYKNGAPVYCQGIAPEYEHEALVKDTLLEILKSRMNIYGPVKSDIVAVFDGLSKNNRWQSCLDEYEGALALAAGLAFFIGVAASDGEAIKKRLLRAVTPTVVDMLNEWLSPAPAYVDLPSPETITRALFGDAWWTLSVEGVCSPSWAFNAIRTGRPDFVPGLLPEHLSIAAVDLPVLGAS
jgi:hypothetical protein